MQVTIKGAVYFDTESRTHEWMEPYKFFTGAVENFSTYVTVMPHEFTVDIPDDFDPRPVEIQALEAREKALAAEFENARSAIRRRISELQAITFEAA